MILIIGLLTSWVGNKYWYIKIVIGVLIFPLFHLSPVDLRMPDFEKQRIVDQAVESISKEINQENIKNDFQISSYRTNSYTVSNSVLLIPLEERFNSDFTKIDDKAADSFSQTNSDKYKFLACFSYSGMYPVSECHETFLSSNPQFRVSKLIYENPQLTVYKTAKIN
jgi:hypothetical protein